ncbi:cytosine permease [Mycobacterium frederiksbergense]|uniref:Cytosine permease n=1 Tax=Mycolicibacterium frederiksbergense TaxID=117567 RepID=A0A6H0S6E3_9MYCO|nr:cytosine permease [Mycolicibacterium frederiksbergense]MCV7046256.1 cytosine permease [Mycolicibacterium frederiksbergense]QIV82918.1 cytosine permease [Mycolicibacterium frederiksbergense]
MTTSPADIAPDESHQDASVRFDAHGIEPIPDDSRDCSPWELFWIWSGANIAPINWVLGALGITLGLSLVETLIVVAAGNLLGCTVFGVFNVIGHRTAVNQMVLGRAPFGRLGAVIPGVVQFFLTMGWVGVNTWVVLDLVMAILAEVGVTGGVWLDFVVASSIMAVQLGLALYGFYAIRSFEKYTVPATVLVMAAMTAMAIATTDVNWSLAGTALEPGEKFTAITQLLTAIGIGWGLTWIPYASDYSRFVRRSATPRAVFWSSSLGMYIPTVWLAALGACLASAGNGSDPSTLVVGTFGVMAIPVLLLLIHGPIATNILNLYSCSLAALSIGVRAARWKVTLIAGVVATMVLAVFVNAESFAHAFDNWMVSILVWISPWAAIMLVDYLVIRRGALDVGSLYGTEHGRYHAAGLISLAAGIVAGWSWQYGLVPAMQGPLAIALGNTDFSWLSGSLVAGGLYYALNRKVRA